MTFFRRKEDEEEKLLLLQLPVESPLAVGMCAGLVALPQVLALLALFQSLGQKLDTYVSEWTQSLTLPIDLDLGPKFHFHHSVYNCPICRLQEDSSNTACKLPCGHAMCRSSS
eukprot:GHVU01174661.1.p1 GENE.GHVU01174661.1~~GHVU01174661.1.p1  ORF type:complete len:113 (+),score=7.51 GHVU01174661.1:1-339(+)